MNELFLTLLITLLILEIRSQDPLGLPDPAMTQQLLSSIPKFSKAIKDQLEGKPDTVRNIISSVFGNGLLRQLVDPSQMANQLARNLDNQLLRPTLGTPDSKNSEQKPRSKMSQLFLSTDSTSSSEPKEQLFVDGRPVKDENKIFRIYDMNKDPNEPERMHAEAAVTDNSNPEGGGMYALKYTSERLNRRPPTTMTRATLITSTKHQVLTTTTPGTLIDADTIFKTLNQFFGTDSSTTTVENSAGVTGNGKLTVQQIRNDLPAVGTDQEKQHQDGDNVLKTSEAFVDDILNSMKTRQSKTLLPEEVKALQQYLVLHEQNHQTRELLNKRQRLRQIQAQLEEQRMKIEEQKFREKQLRIQEAQLREEKLNVENQLQQQYSMWHRAFDVQPLLASSTSSRSQFTNEIPFGERLLSAKSSTLHEYDLDYAPESHYPRNSKVYPDYNSDLTDPHAIVSAVDYDPYLPVANDPVDEEFLGTAVVSPEILQEPESEMNPVYEYVEASSLRLPPRPEPSTVVQNSSVKLPSSFNQTFYGRFNPSSLKESSSLSGRCDCIEIDLHKLNGHWAQPLSSISLQRQFRIAVAELFDDNTDSAQIDCSNIEFSHAEQINHDVQQVDLIWTFKTLHSERYFRLNGKIELADGRVAHLQLNDFTDRTFQIPVCVLKAGEQEENDYEYMVVVNADGPCRSAAVFVRNPGTFFEEPSRELIYYLRHRIAMDELDPMDVHLKPCST